MGRKRKNVREIFCSVTAVAIAEAGGGVNMERMIYVRITTRSARERSFQILSFGLVN